MNQFGRSWTRSSEPLSPGWRVWPDRVEFGLPYALLLSSVALQLLTSEQDGGHQRVTLAIAATALVWVALTDTLPRLRWPSNRVLPVISLIGLITLGAVLMGREVLYLTFLITAFFHAIRIRPLWLAYLGLLASSVFIQSMANGGPLVVLAESPEIFLPVVAVQSLAIGGGALVSDKLTEQSQKRREALAALEAAMSENAGLHRQLLLQAREAGVQDERQRLSREIHDTLAQGFTGIVTQLEAAELAADEAGRRRHLTTAAALARENLSEARRAVHALGPGDLDTARLPEALRGIAQRWSERAGVPIEFTSTGDVRPLHQEVEATLLRITQEALANVAKHAAAGRVGLTLSYMEDQVTLDVRDDGRGFALAALPRAGNATGGFGLAGMRQRAQRLAGTLHIESEPGSGTAISANVPAVPAGSAQ